MMETAVRILEILYLPSSQRNTKRVLQLYNITWLHHTLCSRFFPRIKHVTRTAFFGLYLHHLVVYAPQQYELISLNCVDTEAKERLFGQAKQLAHQASNRHVDTVIFYIMARLQAKELLKQNSMQNTLKEQSKRVNKAASSIHNYQGTKITLKMHYSILDHGKGNLVVYQEWELPLP